MKIIFSSAAFSSFLISILMLGRAILTYRVNWRDERQWGWLNLQYFIAWMLIAVWLACESVEYPSREEWRTVVIASGGILIMTTSILASRFKAKTAKKQINS